jgi:hypothetical protein
VVHFSFLPRRFDGDRNVTHYARWTGDQLTAESVSGLGSVHPESLQISADGTPLIGRGEGGRITEILRRTPAGWRKHLEVPVLGAGATRFICGPRDEIYLADITGDDRRWELLLLTNQKGAWSVKKIISDSSRPCPNYTVLLLDHQQRPAVVVGRLLEPFGWLDLVRSKP